MKQLSIPCFGMLVIFLLCCVGCTDHEPQINTYSTVTTGEVTQQGDGTHRFTMSFNGLGNVPVKEYGVVYSKAGDANFHATPTTSDLKVIFDQSVSVGGKQKVQNVGGTLANFVVRAYAIHGDNTVVYGATLEYD